ncbi:MAG: hypothetical protein O9320_08860 [Magnetospirillum sp.]|nr:hypothetical protein [Magnetospirillum sp.]
MAEPVTTEIDIRTEKSEAGLRRLAEALKATGASTETVTAKLDAQQQEFVRLTARTDVASATRLSFERAEKRLGAALDAGRISTEQYTAALDQFIAKQTVAIQRSQGFGAAAGAAAGGTRNLGQLAGQAGFQLQDFAVQVQGGTSALTALSQQGSQFLGIFGAGGAIAGAALAFGAIATQIALTTGAFDALLGRSAELQNLLKIANDFIDDQAKAAERGADPYERMASNLAKAQIELAKLTEAEDKRRARDAARVQGEQDQGYFDPNQMSTTADPRLGQAQQTVTRAELARDVAVIDEIEKGRVDRQKQLNDQTKEAADIAERARTKAERDAEREADQQRRRNEGLAERIANYEREAMLAGESKATKEEELRLVEAQRNAGRELTEIEEARIRTATRIRQEIDEQTRLADEARRKAERDAEREAEQLKKRQEALDDYIVTLEREAMLAGQTKEVRAEELRLLEAKKKAGRDLTQEEEARIRNASRTKEENERMRREADETAKTIDRSFERAFDRVGDSLVDMAVKGGKAFGDLRSIAAGVATSIYADFLKLAVANPLKKFLLGGGDEGGVGGIFGKIGGIFGSGDQGGGMMSADFGGGLGSLSYMAGGGRITGGTPGKDSVPVMGMPGEFVVQKSAVDSVGLDFMQALNDNGVRALEAASATFARGSGSGSSAGGGGVTIIDQRSAASPPIETSTDSDGRTIAIVRGEIRNATPRIVNLSVSEVENRSARGALKLANA